MKYLVRHLSVGLLVVALAGSAVFGKDKTKSASVSFSSDVTVGGTVVKAGDYKVKFNQETGELSVLKGGKIMAKTMASLQDRADKARSTTVRFRDNELVSIAFGGDRQDVVVGQGGSATGSTQ